MIHLCALEELANHSSRGFSVHEQSIFVVRQDHKVFAYRNRCPHLRVPLEWQPDRFLDADGELIQCSTHGALFTIDEGLCIYGPCSGQSLEPLAVEIRDAQVWVNVRG